MFPPRVRHSVKGKKVTGIGVWLLRGKRAWKPHVPAGFPLMASSHSAQFWEWGMRVLCDTRSDSRQTVPVDLWVPGTMYCALPFFGIILTRWDSTLYSYFYLRLFKCLFLDTILHQSPPDILGFSILIEAWNPFSPSLPRLYLFIKN